MGGYLPSSLSRLYKPRRSRGKYQRKQERGQYPAILTEKTWSITNLLYGKKENYFLAGQRREIPSR